MGVRTGTRVTKTIKVESPPDSWEEIEADYRAACSLSCKPDDSFQKVKTGDVIDEDKSVRWNREEVERLKEVYAEEVKRLNREKNSAITDATMRAVRLISQEAEVSEEKARILWDFVYEKYHAYGEMFQHIDEYIDLVNQMKE